jgi:hypothetical protein
VLHKHIITCEERHRDSTQESLESGQFHSSMMQVFSEDHFISPVYVYHFTRVSPIAKLGFNVGMRKLQSTYEVPSLAVVHNFLFTLFSGAQLSAECSIVCLIYVERLMEIAHVPLMSTTWRPCVMCGLLLASKVWQDLRFSSLPLLSPLTHSRFVSLSSHSSWNSEIAQIFPQFTVQKINRLERTFCHHIKWDLYISSSLYAKYYFALRSFTEKTDFRRSYSHPHSLTLPSYSHCAHCLVGITTPWFWKLQAHNKSRSKRKMPLKRCCTLTRRSRRATSDPSNSSGVKLLQHDGAVAALEGDVARERKL